MMKTKTQLIPYTTVDGAGNDFVIVDGRDGALPHDLSLLARQMCARYEVDGLLVIESPSSKRAHLRMRIFNPDGTEPAMCGNGATCFAQYAHANMCSDNPLRIEMASGILEARILNQPGVQLEMPTPSHFGRERCTVGTRDLEICTVTVGVPHAVVLVDNVEAEDVVGLGRAIRQHPRFAPEGTNVNFVQLDAASVRIRTYERGVEDETLACGSGTTAAAAVLWKYFASRPSGRPVQVFVVRSGGVLRVTFEVSTNHIQRAFLIGPVRIGESGTFPFPWKEH